MSRSTRRVRETRAFFVYFLFGPSVMLIHLLRPLLTSRTRVNFCFPLGNKARSPPSTIAQDGERKSNHRVRRGCLLSSTRGIYLDFYSPRTGLSDAVHRLNAFLAGFIAFPLSCWGVYLIEYKLTNEMEITLVNYFLSLLVSMGIGYLIFKWLRQRAIRFNRVALSILVFLSLVVVVLFGPFLVFRGIPS